MKTLLKITRVVLWTQWAINKSVEELYFLSILWLEGRAMSGQLTGLRVPWKPPQTNLLCCERLLRPPCLNVKGTALGRPLRRVCWHCSVFLSWQTWERANWMAPAWQLNPTLSVWPSHSHTLAFPLPHLYKEDDITEPQVSFLNPSVCRCVRVCVRVCVCETGLLTDVPPCVNASDVLNNLGGGISASVILADGLRMRFVLWGWLLWFGVRVTECWGFAKFPLMWTISYLELRFLRTVWVSI